MPIKEGLFWYDEEKLFPSLNLKACHPPGPLWLPLRDKESGHFKVSPGAQKSAGLPLVAIRGRCGGCGPLQKVPEKEK
jgi:hypothetical protein